MSTTILTLITLRSKLPSDSEEMKRYDQCEIFKEDCSLEPQSIEGAVIVNMTGEEIILSENELNLLKRGPKYCVLKSDTEEAFCCQVEVCPHSVGLFRGP